MQIKEVSLFLKQKCNFLKEREDGYSLVEISIVLVIIGILGSIAVKGYQLINNTKTKVFVTQCQQIITAVHDYHDSYGFFPGDDPDARTRFNASFAGNGDHTISDEESKHVFDHLCKGGFFTKAQAPTPKIGGVFCVKSLENGIFLLVSDHQGNGILDKDQSARVAALFDQETTLFEKGSKMVFGIKISS